MSDERVTDYGAGEYTPTNGGKNPPRKISFDDFEIQGESPEQTEKRNPVIPRIKGLKDDLLGGGKRLTSKLFGAANDAAPPAYEENPIGDEFYVQPAPADVPYFSDEELSNVRVRKIPKPQTPPTHHEEIPKVIAKEQEEIVLEDEVISDTLFASIEEEQYEPDELKELIIEEEIEESIPEVAEDLVAQEIAASKILPEERYDPAIKVYLDTLRGFAAAPRRASEVRDPRKDFVLLLSELLDLVREQVDSLSALFFWTPFDGTGIGRR